MVIDSSIWGYIYTPSEDYNNFTDGNGKASYILLTLNLHACLGKLLLVASIKLPKVEVRFHGSK